MKPDRKRYPSFIDKRPQNTIVVVQAPLPSFFHTLPKLFTIEGHGSGRQGPSPLAPPEEPAND